MTRTLRIYSHNDFSIYKAVLTILISFTVLSGPRVQQKRPDDSIAGFKVTDPQTRRLLLSYYYYYLKSFEIIWLLIPKWIWLFVLHILPVLKMTLLSITVLGIFC